MSETSRMGSGRVFPPLPPRADPKSPFSTSWWGNAWIDALEESALDQARLARGRTYAREGAVDTITVAPGRIVAYVHGSRPRPYRAELRLRTLTPEGWTRLLDVVTENPAHTLALLDKEVPQALNGAAVRADVKLLPTARELEPSCTCPDRGHPCKHAAALAYQTARLLDADPFVLLLLRGGEEADVLEELAHRNAVRSAAEEQARAADARTRAAGSPSAAALPAASPAGEPVAAASPVGESLAVGSPAAGPMAATSPAAMPPAAASPSAVPRVGTSPAAESSVAVSPVGVSPVAGPPVGVSSVAASPAGAPSPGARLTATPPTATPSTATPSASTPTASSPSVPTSDVPTSDAPTTLTLPGTPARTALATDYRPPLPPPLEPPAHPGTAPAYPDVAGGPAPAALEFLATDAVARAHAYLTAGTAPFATPDPWHDAVRLAASHPGLTGRRSFSRPFAELARSVGRTPTDLTRAAAAWRQGGEEGLATLESPWAPPAGPFDRARSTLAAAGLPRMTVRHNWLTDEGGSVQLRYGRDGRWYPYRGETGVEDWWPEGEAGEDLVRVLNGLLARGEAGYGGE
ncbi:SWIM zinc finger family protein [Streptomyces sp. NPDC059009]|uniref:SWIM zinc finger family protein n=1 Tax=Streptomyces sp. NPDC059009 TaxID=3346694 RepID=UPI0036B18E70